MMMLDMEPTSPLPTTDEEKAEAVAFFDELMAPMDEKEAFAYRLLESTQQSWRKRTEAWLKEQQRSA